ncbi:MAG: ABC transporter ATP-binding protein [Solidesulfovibrio sp.]
MIVANNLAFTPVGGDAPIFKNVSLTIRPGERVGIVGPSGSGKTTLGYHLCGAHRLALAGVTTGELILNCRESLAGGPPGFAGLVGQNPEAQLFCNTAAEEIALGLRARGETSKRCDTAAGELLARYGLSARRDMPLSALSLGQKQLTAILSMLAIVPKVLLLDEPTSYLDASSADRLFEHLDALCRTDGWVVIVIEHDLRRLAGFADRFLRLEDGCLCYDGPPSGCPCAAGLSKPTELPVVAPKIHSGPALRFTDVGFGYGKDAAVLTEIRLGLVPGEVVALTGPNGAGKSTLLRLAKGLAKPTSGGVELADGLGCKRDVGIMFQNPDEQLFAHTVEAECGYWLANLGVSATDRERLVLESLTSLGLGEMLNRSPFSLSFGEKRRLCLASVLVAEPAVLCLDEPTTGLDDGNMAVMAAIVRRQAASGKAVLLATHDVDFAAATATRIIWLENGRIVSDAPNPEWVA